MAVLTSKEVAALDLVDDAANTLSEGDTAAVHLHGFVFAVEVVRRGSNSCVEIQL
jgi:hypothetical protein